MGDIPKIYFYQPFYPQFFTGGELYQNKIYEYFINNNVDAYIFGNSQHNKSKFSKILFGFRSLKDLPRDCIIICTNNECVHFFLPILFRRIIFKERKYFLIVHHLIQELSKKYFLKKIENMFVKNSDYIITVSESTKSELSRKKLVKDNITVINPGVDIEPRFINKIKNQILFVANLEERKGLHILLDALSKLNRWDYKLFVIGDDKRDIKYSNRIRKQIAENNLSDNVIIKGKVSYSELLSYYFSSSIFVFPSQLEGFGLSLAEAMKSGLAIIASNIPTTMELLVDGEGALLFEKNNVEKLKEKLELLIDDDELRKRLSRNVLIKSQSLNKWNETAEQVFENIMSLIK